MASWAAVGPRVGAIVAILAVLAIGMFLSGKLERDSRDRVAESEHVDAGEIERAVAERQHDQALDPEAFARAVADDAAGFGLEGFDPEALGTAQPYALLIEDGVVLAPGQSWSLGGIRVAVTAEKVQYQKLGAMVGARHSIAVITNVSKRPLAYFARLRSQERGLCEVRGSRMHNAIALMPGESAEIVVCAGAGQVRVDRLEVLEISPLGYHYISQLPPGAIGHDSITAGGHQPMSRVPVCHGVDVTGLSAQLRQGLVRWVDVIDFYSRHNCHRFQFFDGYRHEPAARPVPARPPA
jgi:hypothetical protein